MNKKAASVLVMLFEIMVVIFVVFITFEIARTYASSETANKINLANDLKMMVDTLVGTSGDAVVEYPADVSKYIFILDANSITVFIKGESEQRMVLRRFSLPQGYNAMGTLEEKERLCLKKEGRNIKIEECQ